MFIISKIKGYIGNKLNNLFDRKEVLNSKKYRDFYRTRNEKRLILLDTPEHGNLGDQAIVLAELKFMADYFGDQAVYEFTQREYLACRKQLRRDINEKDIILIPGGGFIGTLWENEQKVFLDILSRFSENRMIVFPQTVFFEESQKGRNEEQKLKKKLIACKDITIFVRDLSSQKILTERMEMLEEQCPYVPDIVTYLKHKNENKNERKNRVLLCLRSDKEKVLEHASLISIISKLKELGFEVLYTDTVINQNISPDKRMEEVYKKLDEFAHAKLVITDRLHGMLFATITSTLCLSVDNVSKKVSGVYEWVKQFEYVKCVKDREISLDLIMQLLECKDNYYNNDCFVLYYECISKCIAGREIK